MIALIQRVVTASVCVESQRVGAIDAGIVALIGVERADERADAVRLLQRMLAYRLFNNDAGRMNRSLRDTGGGLLLVPQFTLAADTRGGNRPGFAGAADAALAAPLFDHLLQQARAVHSPVAAGIFGAHMQVALVNDGPVTFWLQTGGRSTAR